MALFTWEEKYSVGINVIDGQHKKIFDLINELHDAMKTGKGKEVLAKILDGLVDYTKFHFQQEEDLMTKHGYPDVVRHKLEHVLLTDKVIKMQERYYQGNPAVAVELSTFLKDWLANHILGTDQKYSKFFIEKGVI